MKLSWMAVSGAEELVHLLKRGVLVQPGWFYDFPDEPWTIVSLLTAPRIFCGGLGTLSG
jgi:hypothetical protein